MKYFFSLLAIILGFLLVRYSNYLVENFGHNEWAEHYLGTSGGSRLMWKLIGIIIIITAFLAISGIGESLLTSIFSGLGGNIR
jgi:TRAP-type mannitol/chloroaromatic compound transport system permease small subunit